MRLRGVEMELRRSRGDKLELKIEGNQTDKRVSNKMSELFGKMNFCWILLEGNK